jgi:hypothetical protein
MSLMRLHFFNVPMYMYLLCPHVFNVPTCIYYTYINLMYLDVFFVQTYISGKELEKLRFNSRLYLQLFELVRVHRYFKRASSNLT